MCVNSLLQKNWLFQPVSVFVDACHTFSVHVLILTAGVTLYLYISTVLQSTVYYEIFDL